MDATKRADQAARLASHQSTSGYQKNQAHLDGMRAYELGGDGRDNPYHNWLADCWQVGYDEAKEREGQINALS